MNYIWLLQEVIDDSFTVGKAELGNVKINNVGVSIKILTCKYKSLEKKIFVSYMQVLYTIINVVGQLYSFYFF